MANVPTELLRTLVAVVDLRSFTKAAQSFGITQPAVSAQIKRLQAMLGVELLDKSAPGVSLTPAGDLVVNYARRLLAINDQIVDVATPRVGGKVLRIGCPSDSSFAHVVVALARVRAERPELRFVTRSAPFDALLRDLHQGDIDIVISASNAALTLESTYCWTDKMCWLRGATSTLDPERPVPLVAFREECLFTRLALSALREAGLTAELVLVSSSVASLGAAIAAGLGFMALPRGRAVIPGTVIWDGAPLPKLPDVFCAVHVRDGADADDRQRVAEAIVRVLRPAAAPALEVAAV